MKAEDLMTDNWVNYNGTYQQVEVINGTDNQVYLTEDEVVDCPDIYPIPLTKEILEKNGFIENTGAFYAFAEESYSEQDVDIILFNVDIDSRNNQLHICNPATPNDHIIHLMACNYVHQLQNALKICGIKKELKV